MYVDSGLFSFFALICGILISLGMLLFLNTFEENLPSEKKTSQLAWELRDTETMGGVIARRKRTVDTEWKKKKKKKKI